MKDKERLTNACFLGYFQNVFDLAEYAIHLANYLIRSGRGATLKTVLEEVLAHPNPSYLTHLREEDLLTDKEKGMHET